MRSSPMRTDAIYTSHEINITYSLFCSNNQSTFAWHSTISFATCQYCKAQKYIGIGDFIINMPVIEFLFRDTSIYTTMLQT